MRCLSQQRASSSWLALLASVGAVVCVWLSCFVKCDLLGDMQIHWDPPMSKIRSVLGSTKANLNTPKILSRSQDVMLGNVTPAVGQLRQHSKTWKLALADAEINGLTEIGEAKFGDLAANFDDLTGRVVNQLEGTIRGQDMLKNLPQDFAEGFDQGVAAFEKLTGKTMDVDGAMKQAMVSEIDAEFLIAAQAFHGNLNEFVAVAGLPPTENYAKTVTDALTETAESYQAVVDTIKGTVAGKGWMLISPEIIGLTDKDEKSLKVPSTVEAARELLSAASSSMAHSLPEVRALLHPIEKAPEGTTEGSFWDSIVWQDVVVQVGMQKTVEAAIGNSMSELSERASKLEKAVGNLSNVSGGFPDMSSHMSVELLIKTLEEALGAAELFLDSSLILEEWTNQLGVDLVDTNNSLMKTDPLSEAISSIEVRIAELQSALDSTRRSDSTTFSEALARTLQAQTAITLRDVRSLSDDTKIWRIFSPAVQVVIINAMSSPMQSGGDALRSMTASKEMSSFADLLDATAFMEAREYFEQAFLNNAILLDVKATRALIAKEELDGLLEDVDTVDLFNEALNTVSTTALLERPVMPRSDNTRSAVFANFPTLTALDIHPLQVGNSANLVGTETGLHVGGQRQTRDIVGRIRRMRQRNVA
eukprot:GHVQ01038610.1.p1 GENE.GHVQ01038610.1~~GHVQ01038610.1.p1  ORF type:complete len:647 (-),score=80.19 GHVQ01038610.1:131-2071(-)